MVPHPLLFRSQAHQIASEMQNRAEEPHDESPQHSSTQLRIAGGGVRVGGGTNVAVGVAVGPASP